MNKIFITIILFNIVSQAIQIPTKHSKKMVFKKSIKLNSQIIQLSNENTSLTSVLSGYIEKYYVKTGDNIKFGDEI
jgi:biotin carboxyl carrier protein